ncbi:MAG TPA: hypothetical protein VGL24_06085 [Chthoniobacterales bacterium]|jgi:hypothetical protein
MSRILVGIFVLFVLSGCDRKHAEAIVLEKEHIAVQEPTPSPSPALDTQNNAPAAAGAEPEEQPREMAPDEIEADGVVMKAAMRGTGRDPRASAEEQWLVKVRTDNGRTFNIHSDKARFEKIHTGDSVQVVYRVGKYTGTVWSADFE